MPNKTIYVREADTELWEEAERFSGGNVSGLIAEALRRYVDEEKRKEQGMEAIEVQVGGRDDTTHTVRFQGMWLVEPDEDDTRTTEADYDAGTYFGVALTKRNQIAVYSTDSSYNPKAELRTYPSFDAAELAGCPKDILAEARRGVDPDYVEDLDI